MPRHVDVIGDPLYTIQRKNVQHHQTNSCFTENMFIADTTNPEGHDGLSKVVVVVTCVMTIMTHLREYTNSDRIFVLSE